MIGFRDPASRNAKALGQPNKVNVRIGEIEARIPLAVLLSKVSAVTIQVELDDRVGTIVENDEYDGKTIVRRRP